MAGRPAGLRPGPLASFASDALCFRDDPWLGCVSTFTSTSTTVAGASGNRYGDADRSWQDHQEVFRAVLGSFVS